jgi:hypothetical protein
VSRDPNATTLPFPAGPEAFAPLDPATERALAEALRSAWSPAPLDPAVHRRILEAALEDPFAEASEEEARESARLRRALDGDDTTHPDVELARALRSAVNPAPGKPVAVPFPRSTARVVYATFGALALAAAAGFALLVARPQQGSPSTSAALRPLHASRPTGELFAERFKTGRTTDRIDRIATAREHDLRENRYAMWGVR